MKESEDTKSYLQRTLLPKSSQRLKSKNFKRMDQLVSYEKIDREWNVVYHGGDYGVVLVSGSEKCVKELTKFIIKKFTTKEFCGFIDKYWSRKSGYNVPKMLSLFKSKGWEVPI